MGPPPQGGHTLWWPIIARNKKSVTLNLREGEGQDLATRLIAEADVLVENFRPGTMERWGLGYEDLSEINPGLVMVRVSGYGQTGPYKDQAGFGSIGEAMGGIRYVTGYPDRPPPRVGISLGDSLAATFGALGAVTALYDREARGGRGPGGGRRRSTRRSRAHGEHHPGVRARRARPGPHRGHPAVCRAVEHLPDRGRRLRRYRGQRRHRLRAVRGGLGRPSGPRTSGYATHHARGENQEELDAMISGWTKERAAEEVMEVMEEAGVPAGQAVHREGYGRGPALRRPGEHRRGRGPRDRAVPDAERCPAPDRDPRRVRWTGPRLGQHNDEVFGEVLGMDERGAGQLRERGIV